MKTQSQQPPSPQLARREKLTRALPTRGHPRPTARVLCVCVGGVRCLWPPWQAGAYSAPDEAAVPQGRGDHVRQPNPTLRPATFVPVLLERPHENGDHGVNSDPGHNEAEYAFLSQKQSTAGTLPRGKRDSWYLRETLEEESQHPFLRRSIPNVLSEFM